MPLSLLLTGWYTTASFLVVAIATGLLYFGLATNLREISEQTVLDQLDVCNALARERAGDLEALLQEVDVDSAARRYQKVYIRIIGTDGRPMAATPGMDRELSPERITEAAMQRNRIFSIESATGVPYLALIGSLADSRGKTLGTLQLTMDLTKEQEILARQRVWVWAVLAAALLVSPAVGFAIARRGTRPLRAVAETAQHIKWSTLSDRIHADGYPSEVRVLADAFNAMLERLEQSFERLSRFSADIAHELRNPVNNIRGEAEVALKRVRTPSEYVETLGSCLEETVRLSELIESLLFLARSESPGDHLKRTDENIAQLLAGVREYYEANAAELGVSVTITVPPGLTGEVDRPLIQRALGNLVSNALAHCSAGDRISLSAIPQDDRIRIEVRDTGSGIPAEALPRVFDRFYRADPARSRDSGGMGLGLAIVRQIVFLHGGDVEISSEPNRGTNVVLVLPRSGTAPRVSFSKSADS
ncbi:MAG TPA: heavy metal sensor histidine kinase [Bryobacteraceae bacterium]|nr:heavy metal sensor histidine kinase [Bryobacteraceae bacterium]